MQYKSTITSNSSRLGWCVVVVVWGVAVAGVWAWTTQYEFKTHIEDLVQPEPRWPAKSSLVLAADRPTLLFFLHPRCPCSRASLRELERTLTGTGLSSDRQPKVIVVASLPADLPDEWRNTDTIESAAALPRAEIVFDAGGKETSLFGATTSGSVRLYRSDGELLFAGGVTASRGHEGDSTGSDRLHALLSRRVSVPQAPTPVFGCSLCVESDPTDRDATCRLSVPGGQEFREEAGR